jgi:membrane protein YqaA with SNARE-associated domain
MLEGYFGLFLVAFLAATLLPTSSEAFCVGLLSGGYDPWALWAWATVGNSLGAAVNWLLGRYLLHYQDRSWFPFRPASLQRAHGWFQRYGIWSLLLSWAPLFGDALTFIAGLMKVRFSLFLLLTALGKGTRYAIILGLGWVILFPFPERWLAISSLLTWQGLG